MLLIIRPFLATLRVRRVFLGGKGGGRGCHMMQFVTRNVAKVELDSTSATVARNVGRKVAPCVRAF